MPRNAPKGALCPVIRNPWTPRRAHDGAGGAHSAWPKRSTEPQTTRGPLRRPARKT
jgi:hypothetical protein